jgi:hypothetical protein
LAKFVLDFPCRERGFGKVRDGFYDMHLTPVGTTRPELPGNDYKPAIGCWLWNPTLGQLRFETCAALARNAMLGVWERVKLSQEYHDGLVPVIHFTDRYSREFPLGTYWSPVIPVLGYGPRDKIPPFALREPTVPPPAALDNQLKSALLQGPGRKEPEPVRPQESKPARPRNKPRSGAAAPKHDSLAEFLDDDLPESMK